MTSRVQPHLKKCFEGIAKLKFNKELDVLAMISSQGEEVPLIDTISTTAARGQVEKWLIELEKLMRQSIRQVVKDAMDAYFIKERVAWVLDWPGQTILCVGQMYWTQQIEEGMLRGVDGLRDYFNQSQMELNDIISLIRGKLPKQNRISLGNQMDLICDNSFDFHETLLFLFF